MSEKNYERVNWQARKTPLSAANLNHMDEGIAENRNAILALQQAQAGGLTREIITNETLAELVADPSKAADNVIYMVPNQGEGTSEVVYDEYIKVRISAADVTPVIYAIEFLGNTKVDLSQYYTKEEIAGLGYATIEYVNTELNKKVSISSYTTDQNNLKGRVDQVEAQLSDIAENPTIKSAGDGLVIDENHVIKFAEGIFVLDGGNASNRPTQVEKAE